MGLVKRGNAARQARSKGYTLSGEFWLQNQWFEREKVTDAAFWELPIMPGLVVWCRV